MSATLGHLPDARITGLLLTRAYGLAKRAVPYVNPHERFASPCAYELIFSAATLVGLAKRTAPKGVTRGRIEALVPDMIQVLRALATDTPVNAQRELVTEITGKLARFTRTGGWR